MKLHLLEDDTHWNDTLTDAAASSTPFQIRTLFAIIISTCFPASPGELWNNHKNSMTEDILYRMRIATGNHNLDYTSNMYNEVLILVEDLCLSIANKALTQLGMIAPNRNIHDIFNKELEREQQYDRNALSAYLQANEPFLNTEQKRVYDTIMHAVNTGSGGFYFLDAPGGTGKTFVMSLILANIRANGFIALAIASSGIAATLLEGGRTAHSALKLPLNLQVNEEPTCNISKRSGMARVLQQCKIIIWDECTMAHKKSLEALNRTLKDLRENQRLFGNALILLTGDFRQTLPVIPRSTPADELNACLKASNLWRYVTKLTLNTNVRVQLQNDSSAEVFSKQLLQIGNGRIPIDNNGLFKFPDHFCQIAESKADLVQKVFPDITQNYKNHNWLSERAILAGTNKDVNEINADILDKIPGDTVVYRSVDTIIDQDQVVNYPTEFLNSLDISGFPPHYLQLKVGATIIMLRNINHPKLCNGTRLVVKRLMNNVIEATILIGKFKNEDVLIPRIPMIPPELPFEFKRLQLPIRLAFAITINKSQGQTLEICGMNLEEPVFTHGQLYVGCSRVGKPTTLYIYSKTNRKTKSVVYAKALE